MRCGGFAGIYARDQSYVELSGFYIANNAQYGLNISICAGCNLEGQTGGWAGVSSNGGYGIGVNQMSKGTFNSVSCTGNTSGPIQASSNGFARFLSADGNTYSGGSMSPAINTLGNVQSYISV